MITVRIANAGVDHVAFSLDRPHREPVELHFRSSALDLVASGDAALVAALPLAIAERVPLKVEPPVSARLRAAVATILDVHAVWQRAPEARIPVETTAGSMPRRGRRHGGVFSHDLASFHLALAPEPPDLMFVVDADLPAGLDGPFGPCGASPLVETNLRRVGAEFGLDWPSQYRGAALAATAHCVADLDRVDLPAPFSVHYLFPWGSHTVLDPLWSGDGLEVRHRHAERDWVEQLALVADRPDLLGEVRVCHRERDGRACGRCRPCLFLAAGLKVVEARGDPDVDLDALRALDLRHYTALADAAVLLRHADRDAEADLVDAVEAAVRRLSPDEVRWPDNWFSYLAELGSARR